MNHNSGTGNRNSSIELLRIFCMCGVIILHFNNVNIGGGLKFALHGNYILLNLLESFFICAVNVFILISGYFYVDRNNRNLIKPIRLIFQLVVFQLLIYVLDTCINGSNITLSNFIYASIPRNWFIILYVVLYVFSPFINAAINKLSLKNFRLILIISLIVFSFWNIAIDVLQAKGIGTLSQASTIGASGDEFGYTIVNFALMYLVGAYIKKREKNCHVKKWICFVVMALITVLIYYWSTKASISLIAWYYCNPLNIVLAVAVFLLFKDLKFQSRVINIFAKGAFTVFISHEFFFQFIPIETICSTPWYQMLGFIFIMVISLYIIGWVLSVLWDLATGWLFKFLSKNVPFLTKDLYYSLK